MLASRQHTSKGGTMGFFQVGTKSGESWFFPLETKKTTFFCWKFQNSGGTFSPFWQSWAWKHDLETFSFFWCKLKLETFSFFWCKYLNTDSRNQLFTGEKGLKNYKNQPTFFKNILCKKSLGQLKNN